MCLDADIKKDDEELNLYRQESLRVRCTPGFRSPTRRESSVEISIRIVGTEPEVRMCQVRTTLQMGGRRIVTIQQQDLRERSRFVRVACPFATLKGREEGSNDPVESDDRDDSSTAQLVERGSCPHNPPSVPCLPRVGPRALTNDVLSARPLLPHRRRSLRGAAVRFDFSCVNPSLP